MTGWTRRGLLGGSAALATVSFLPTIPARTASPPNPLFTLGIASGDPWPDSVVLWTRLARDPLHGGGMGNASIPVNWEIAADENFRQIVRSGTAIAVADYAHSVHVEVGGLQPHRWYWYRFNALGVESAVGRTRTAPVLDADLDRMRIAFASCQHYERGYYSAYRHMAEDEIDLMLHLGDYIYEGKAKDDRPRRHNSAEVETLAEYRSRYALYKLDPDLQAAHAAFPWAAVPDDHEVENDYAAHIDQTGGQPAKAFLARRAAAYQAYYEHLPFRSAARPIGPDMLLHRTLRFGRLAAINLLDTRQHRSDQPCWATWSPPCAEMRDPAATMLGAAQERWLYDAVERSPARWNVLAQQVPIFQRTRIKGGQTMLHMDKWDGYPTARQRLFDAVQRSAQGSMIVLSGDVHGNWAGDLRADFGDPTSTALGAEFVGTSISSNGDGWDSKKKFRRIVDGNPHIAFYNGQCGYTRCDITRERWRTDFRVLPYVSRPGAPISTRASFVVERGSNRLSAA